MSVVRRGCAAVMCLAVLVGACGGEDEDGMAITTTTRSGRFPPAVASTTTAAPESGVTTTIRRRVNTATTARRAGPAATTTTERKAPTPPVPTPAPEARTEVAGAAWKGKVVVAGGLRADGGASDRVDVYDPSNGEWSRAPDLPVALHHAALAVLGDDLWAVGGFTTAEDKGWVAARATYRLPPAAKAWEAGPTLTRARGALGLASVDDRLIAFGGKTTEGDVLASVEVLVSDADDWAPGPSLTQAREHTAAMVVNGRAYAVAGRLGGLQTNLTSVESWRPGEDAWREEPSVEDPRGGTAASGGCVAGGEERQRTIATVECLSGDRWRVRFRLREPRHGLAAVVVAGYLHVIAGGPTPGLSVSAAHEVFEL
ncbi:MAG TPA: kelch repeat-containing protein [Acidimicrobiales bacterium]|nr:kelch repeat-containing protein [Acidimicrobiales bacterium]